MMIGNTIEITAGGEVLVAVVVMLEKELEGGMKIEEEITICIMMNEMVEEAGKEAAVPVEEEGVMGE